MSNTPLMSEFPQDTKLEAIYPINDSDVELVVGQPTQRRCFWSRFHRRSCCAANAGEQKPKSKLRKAIKFGLITFFLLSVFHFFARDHLHPHLPWKRHPIVCVPVTDTTTTVELPLANHFTRIGLHPSLTTGESHIIHSDDVKDGTVSITFELPKDSELTNDDGENKVFACHIAGPRFVALGVHYAREHKKDHKEEHKKDDDHPHPPHHAPVPGPKALKTTVALPASEAGKARGISFHGAFGFHGRKFGPGCMKRRIQKAIRAAIRAEREAKAAAIAVEEAVSSE